VKSRSFERKLGQLEKVFSAGEPKDDWIDSVMWNIQVPVGCFGHTHHRFSESRRQTEKKRYANSSNQSVNSHLHHRSLGCLSGGQTRQFTSALGFSVFAKFLK